MTARMRASLIVGLALAAYVLIVLVYAANGNVTRIALQGDTPPKGGLVVEMTIVSVDSRQQRLAVDVTIRPSADLTVPGTDVLASDIDVTVAPLIDSHRLHFARGEVPGRIPVEIALQGDVEEWPFDTYQASINIKACSVPCGGSSSILHRLVLLDPLPGWGVSSKVSSDSDYQSVEMGRALSTVVSGGAILILLAVMAGLVLTVAWVTLHRRRSVEAGFFGWMAAMLFAVVPLRSFLPDSPPVGSWIDVTVTLWAIVAMVTGLVMYVSAWFKAGTKNDARNRYRRQRAVRMSHQVRGRKRP